MQRFILEQSDNEFYTSHSGLALIGLCINRYSRLPEKVTRKLGASRNIISHADILRNYLGLLCLGKSDFEAITPMRNDSYFRKSLGIKHVPSPERLRQRLDETAERLLPVVRRCAVEMLKKGKVHVSPVATGHIPLDADVFALDNSGHQKRACQPYLSQL